MCKDNFNFSHKTGGAGCHFYRCNLGPVFVCMRGNLLIMHKCHSVSTEVGRSGSGAECGPGWSLGARDSRLSRKVQKAIKLAASRVPTANSSHFAVLFAIRLTVQLSVYICLYIYISANRFEWAGAEWLAWPVKLTAHRIKLIYPIWKSRIFCHFLFFCAIFLAVLNFQAKQFARLVKGL